MKRRLALVWILALVSAGCDADPTEPELESRDPTAHSSAGVLQVGENQFAVDFSAYEADQRLWEADWTRIARRWPVGTGPVLGDWRAQDAELSFAGRVAALLDPPLDGRHQIALQWDALPILEPPLEILARLWLPPFEKRPPVGIAWFIQPDATGMLEGFVLERNPPWGGGTWVTKLFDNPRGTSTLVGGTRGEDELAFPAGDWIWIRVRHTIGSAEGTIRYRAWQGSLWDEPSEWWYERTTERFGPDGGGTKPIISGKAGLYVGTSPEMVGAVPLWGAFTVGINGAPAPPPPGASANLVLECVPAEVQRGEPTECTTSTDPASASLTVKEWSFASGNGLSASEISDADSWSGPLVVTGTVTVRADVDGQEQTASAAVAVTPREWLEYVPNSVEDRYVGCAVRTSDCPLLYPPARFADLGTTTPAPLNIGLTERAEPIMSGPNTGWNYVGGTEEPVKFAVHIIFLNRVLREPGHQFYRTKTTCTAPALDTHVRDHEMVHVNLFNAEWPRRLINAWLEQHVGFSSLEQFRLELERMQETVISAAFHAGDTQHARKGLYPLMPCPVHLQWNKGATDAISRQRVRSSYGNRRLPAGRGFRAARSHGPSLARLSGCPPP